MKKLRLGSHEPRRSPRPRKKYSQVLAILAVLAGTHGFAEPRIRILETQPAREVGRFAKFEITCSIDGSAAENRFWPFDPAPPAGIPPAAGISVDGIFTDPQGRDHRQPGFQFEDFRDEIRGGREWVYPEGRLVWKIRFSPDQAGAWQYRIVARDRGGTAETAALPLAVTPSSRKGFIRASRADPRYFEFSDGTLFTGLGFNLEPFLESPVLRGGPQFEKLAASGVNFVRMWIGSIFGSAWNPYRGARNRYGGYLPVTGLVPFPDEAGREILALRLDYEPAGDTGWFDACRLAWADDPEAVKPRTNYRIRVRYRGAGIEGPRRPGAYGLVVKFGGPPQTCSETRSGTAVTRYGRSNEAWEYIEGSWNSGNRNFLPRTYLSLENVTRGAAWVSEVSVREEAGGDLGPEIMTRSSMEHHLYVPQKEAYALDKIVRLAEQSGVYLKLVVMEKDDDIYRKLEDDGSFIEKQDNQDGFYGLGRSMNKTRWLQQAWWRYLQARWGYSPNVHSWELTNEGDPASVRHFELADEFGKFMHGRVFGIEPGSPYRHPNGHLVTTSFWHSFPARQFWDNPAYPDVDYADLHAYVSSSPAPDPEKREMAYDAALYHIRHSRHVAGFGLGKPVVRGEAGLDLPGQHDERALGTQGDRTGVWLHNFLWAGLDSGALYELYWWNSHIWNREQDHRAAYRLIGAFLSELPLNHGGYEDWKGSAGAGLRVVGQKNAAAGRMHLWIQNPLHTWKNVAGGRAIEPVSGEVTVPGFQPGASYRVHWWDTWAAQKTVTSETVAADSKGSIVLRVRLLLRDVAVMVEKS